VLYQRVSCCFFLEVSKGTPILNGSFTFDKCFTFADAVDLFVSRVARAGVATDSVHTLVGTGVLARGALVQIATRRSVWVEYVARRARTFVATLRVRARVLAR